MTHLCCLNFARGTTVNNDYNTQHTYIGPLKINNKILSVLPWCIIKEIRKLFPIVLAVSKICVNMSFR